MSVVSARDAVSNQRDYLATELTNLGFATNFLNSPAPIAANDAYVTNEDTVLAVAAPGVLGNDNDSGSGSNATLTAVLVSGPSHASSFALNSDGSVVYTPAANFSGGDSFIYNVESNTATVNITVTSINDAPVASNDTYVTDEDTALVIAGPGVLGNDNDAADGSTTLTAVLVTAPSNASSFILNSDGSFSYTPNANFNGNDSFTYRAKDAANAESNIATVAITVTLVNDLPVAQNDNFNTNEDTALSLPAPGVLSNDNDPGDGSTTLTAALVSAPSHGALRLNPDGSFEYTPTANFNGNDSFTYKAVDAANAESNVATVTIAVNALNDAPVANNDSYSTNENTQIVMPAPGVLSNDTDVDSPALTAALVSNPLFGTVSFNSDGSFSYTPNPNFNGNDSFSYRTNDGTSNGNVASVNITVNGVNTAPVANNNSWSTNQNTPVIITLSSTDIDSTSLTFSIVGSVSNGTLGPVSVATCTPSGSGSSCTATVSYSPASGFSGGDSFTFRANDGQTNSNIATVMITVRDVTPPAITITSPAANATYQLNASIAASYACLDSGSGVATCQGTVANGSPIDTSSTGTKIFTVSSSDNLGNTGSMSVTYSVVSGGGGGGTSADVGITLAAPSRISPNENLTYSITVTNAGKVTATGVVASDALPAGTVFSSASASQGTIQPPAVGSNGTVTVNLGSLANGAKASVSIVATVTAAAGAVLTNTATVSATTQDLNPKNDSASQKTTVAKK
jgi:uncharacterized repeat protein (TIGR01451 family)